MTPLRVHHASEMECYGYFLSDGQDSVFYSGDANTLPKFALEKLVAGEISCIYQETTYEVGTHPSHCTLEHLCSLVPEELRNRVVCMHFGADFRDAAKTAGFGIAQAEAILV